jgi:hypothetical protein
MPKSPKELLRRQLAKLQETATRFQVPDDDPLFCSIVAGLTEAYRDLMGLPAPLPRRRPGPHPALLRASVCLGLEEEAAPEGR